MSFRSENPSSLLFEVRKNDNGNQNQERNKHTNINDNKSNNHQEPTTYNNHHDTSYNHLQTLACNTIQLTALEHSRGAHENFGTELDCLPNDGPGSLQHRAAKSLPHFPVWTPGISFHCLLLLQGTKLCKIHPKNTSSGKEIGQCPGRWRLHDPESCYNSVNAAQQRGQSLVLLQQRVTPSDVGLDVPWHKNYQLYTCAANHPE